MALDNHCQCFGGSPITVLLALDASNESHEAIDCKYMWINFLWLIYHFTNLTTAKLIKTYTEHCSVWSYQFYRYYYRQYYGADENRGWKPWMKILDEDFGWRFLRLSDDRCYKKSHRIAKCGSIWKRKTDLEYGMVKDYGYVIIFYRMVYSFFTITSLKSSLKLWNKKNHVIAICWVHSCV